MSNQDALVAIFTRNAFYRRLHYLVLLTFALSLVVIAILIGIIVFLLKNPTKPLYFATDEIGRLIQDVPLDQPNMRPEEVVAWAIEAVQAAYSYNYINYRSQLQNAQKYFTTYSWQDYMRALKDSNNLIGVIQRKIIVLARVVGEPKLITQGILGGAYAWRYQMPVLLTNWGPPYNEQSKSLNALSVTIVIQRQPLLQSYKGLGILQFIGRDVTSTQPTEISLTPG
ncbi:MAG: hypothetical protein A3F11_08295 [Gammaproteobacteria bacterium RIFCSPHIGHO2_12_FULL_37_14]|nr:MAG: hypothetical protein A3F11_08295 [Gammaproteobacteria bacterium RIFCSPHIGHO2_12_FULL_37_14]